MPHDNPIFLIVVLMYLLVARDYSHGYRLDSQDITHKIGLDRSLYKEYMDKKRFTST